MDWCNQNEVNPKLVTTRELNRYVRNRLEAGVNVQTVKGGLSGIRKFTELFGWEFADADAVLKFMFTESMREANAAGAKEERDPLPEQWLK